MKDLNTLYRPKKWGDVKGQDKTISMLQKQVISKTGLSNSYILAGKSGIGKTTLARLFFMAMNCQNLSKIGNPCLKCPSCTNMMFELREVNASDSRGIDDMRDLIRDMHLMPATGKFRGVLLDEVHMLSKPAWNCLLKPIEESKHAIWLFCTTEIHKIPKTIQTRCQIYKLTPLRWTDIHNRLKTIVDDIKMSISDEELWTIARNSDNNLRQATHLLEQYSVLGDLKKVLDDEVDINFLNALASTEKSDYKTIWKVFLDWEKKYGDIDAFLNNLKYDLNVCVRIKMELNTNDVNPYRLKKYKEIIDSIPEQKLVKMLQLLLGIQEKISGVWDYNSLFLDCLVNLKNYKEF